MVKSKKAKVGFMVIGVMLSLICMGEVFATSISAESSIDTATEISDKGVTLKSSNAYLQSTFDWAVKKATNTAFVMTGQSGLLNKSERNVTGTGTAAYIPSYWAGYFDRTAFYGRDFAHQSIGANLAGLTTENYSMFNTFAKNSTEARKWYTLWAFNFDGTAHAIDYSNDEKFTREVPAQFELVEKAYEQYLWTGDARYINDTDMFNFYTKTMTDFISLHDLQNPNGIAEGYGRFNVGSCTYNERGEEKAIEAGDSIGSQYQATLAYAGILEARGDNTSAAEWYKKAKTLKDYFNNVWSSNTENPNGNYARVLGQDGKKYYDFGKENSWFIPLKMISEPGERNNNYINFILQNLGDGIKSVSTAPTNIEAYTYIPDMLFLYNRSDDAWKWMKYITSIKDQPHERVSQGTNGDYPEISYTFISQVIDGMMGVEPNSAKGYVATSPRLPGEVNDITANNIQMGNYSFNLTHQKNTSSTLTNISAKDLSWEIRFYGNYNNIIVNGQNIKAQTKDVNGEAVSYTTVNVKAGTSVTAKADNSITTLVAGANSNVAVNPKTGNSNCLCNIGVAILLSGICIMITRKFKRN